MLRSTGLSVYVCVGLWGDVVVCVPVHVRAKRKGGGGGLVSYCCVFSNVRTATAMNSTSFFGDDALTFGEPQPS